MSDDYFPLYRPSAIVLRRNDTRVIVRCPFCNEAHAHGALKYEVIGERVSHCSDRALSKVGPDAKRGVYRVTAADGSPL